MFIQSHHFYWVILKESKKFTYIYIYLFIYICMNEKEIHERDILQFVKMSGRNRKYEQTNYQLEN